jgi:Bacterial protein of unknown function (HtrL_YibB)
MHICRADLASVDLEPLRPFAAGECFLHDREHYRLLAHLSTCVGNGTIFDIGTHLGDSALALSYGGLPVETFDITDNVSGRPHPLNVHRNLVDLWSPKMREAWKERLLRSPLIFLDIDPHEGTREYEFVQWLQTHKYRGILVLDDIWYFKPMRDALWSRIEGRYKTDVTALGHWSGTGIVCFTDRISVEGEASTDNWTLVTGYFDLTRKSDANDAIRARPQAHYIDQHGGGILGVDQNLVIFCESDLEEQVWALRPAHLHATKTCVITQSFEEFPLTRHRAQIVQNRGGPACTVDPRNTASYYLFCMARYAMLKETIRSNPFQSTHFAWTNICIERMGWQNLAHLGEALGVQREKFSTCFIDYIPENVVSDLPRYFGPRGCQTCAARCSMCSGFFTGDSRSMFTVCTRIEEEFLRCLYAGFGHADEQLFPMVYFRDRDLFDWYVGDYAEMITNYAHVYERPGQPIVNLIRNSLSAGDRAVCARACGIVRQSYEAGKCALAPTDLAALLHAERASAS